LGRKKKKWRSKSRRDSKKTLFFSKSFEKEIRKERKKRRRIKECSQVKKLANYLKERPEKTFSQDRERSPIGG